MEITIATVAPEGLSRRMAEVPEGATIGEALRLAGVKLEDGWGVALWGHRCREEDVLSAGDRIDLTAPLICDPKQARRERAEQQGDVRTVTCGRHGSRRTKNEA